MNQKIRAWIQRRWLEFRWGHSVYLAFVLSFVNFLLITFRLLIEYVPVLEGVFQSLVVYALVGVVVYVPLAVVIGHLHRTRQLRVDSSLATEQNPIIMEILERVKTVEEKLCNHV